MIGSPDSINDEENSKQDMVSDLPLILPTHTNKSKYETYKYRNNDFDMNKFELISFDLAINKSIINRY